MPRIAQLALKLVQGFLVSHRIAHCRPSERDEDAIIFDEGKCMSCWPGTGMFLLECSRLDGGSSSSHMTVEPCAASAPLQAGRASCGI